MRVRKNRTSKRSENDRSKKPVGSDEPYRVGPGSPPREFQFKPGQSGNPKGARRKTDTATPNLKLLLERALRKKEPAKRPGEAVRTMSAAGIENLVTGFANGCRYARRDLLVIADQLGVDLAAGQGDAIANALDLALSENDRALVDDFFKRRLAEHEQSLRQSNDPTVEESNDPTVEASEAEATHEEE